MRKITKYGYKHFFSNYFQINSSHAWPLKCKRHFSSHFISKQKLYFTDTLIFSPFFFYFYGFILNSWSKWIDCLMLCYSIFFIYYFKLQTVQFSIRSVMFAHGQYSFFKAISWCFPKPFSYSVWKEVGWEITKTSVASFFLLMLS